MKQLDWKGTYYIGIHNRRKIQMFGAILKKILVLKKIRTLWHKRTKSLDTKHLTLYLTKLLTYLHQNYKNCIMTKKTLNVKKAVLTIPLFINLLDKLWMHFYAKIIPILINQEWIWSQKHNTNSSIIMFYYNSNCINLIWQHFLSVSRVILIMVFLGP